MMPCAVFFQCNFKLFCNASGLSIRTPKYLPFFSSCLHFDQHFELLLFF